MMNESHAGTARASGVLCLAKRRLAGLFDAALVGGKPQQRYAASLGLSPEKIFTGYDAVDNEYFARKAQEVRAQSRWLGASINCPHVIFWAWGGLSPKRIWARSSERTGSF